MMKRIVSKVILGGLLKKLKSYYGWSMLLIIKLILVHNVTERYKSVNLF